MTRIPTTYLAALAGLVLLTLPSAAPAQNREIGLEWLRNAGTRYDGVAASTFAGRSVSSAGDVNGDGIDDLLVASFATGLFAPPGTVYLIYGSQYTTPTNLSLASADVVLGGVQAGSETGFSLGAAGDVDGDGFDDMLIGAKRYDVVGGDSGRVYLVYGDNALPAFIDLGSLAGGLGVVYNGSAAGELVGSSVAGAGDVNGDTLPDFVIGAIGAAPSGKSQAGRAYVIYGSDSLPDVVSLGSLGATDGMLIDGAEMTDHCGGSVSGAGDVNNDGFDDVIVGAEDADPNGPGSGAAYIVYGGNSLPASFSLTALGTAGVKLEGEGGGDEFGVSVSGGGDVNNDGFDDVIVGAHLYDDGATNEGRAYIIYGGASLPNSIDMSSLAGAGVTLTGIDSEDEAGFQVALGGNVNGDKFADVLVSARQGDQGGNATGEVYLLRGGNSLPSSLSLDALSFRGVQFNGIDPNDRAGDSLCFAGDVNNDGFDDFIVGAQFADSSAGEAYLVQGGCNVLNAAGPTAEGQTFTLTSHGTPGRQSLLFYGAFKLPAPADTGVGPFWLQSPFFPWQIKTFDADGQWSVDITVPPGIGLSGLTIYYQVYEDPSPPWCNISQLLATAIP